MLSAECTLYIGTVYRVVYSVHSVQTQVLSGVHTLQPTEGGVRRNHIIVLLSYRKGPVCNLQLVGLTV